MGENDLKNDITDGNVSDEINDMSTETVSVDDVYTESRESSVVNDESYSSDDSMHDVSESAEESVETAEPEILEQENVESENVDFAAADNDVQSVDNASSDAKSHETDLEGFRAYRKRHFLKKISEESVDEKKERDRRFFGESSSSNVIVWIVCLSAVLLFDLFAMSMFVVKQSYSISDKILTALEFNILHFTNITYSQICLALGYVVSFILGGIIILILIKILNKLFNHFSLFKLSGACPIISLGIFALIFVIGFVVSYFSGDALLVLSVYRWGAPALAYLGGLIFYGASKLHVGIEY